MAVCAASITACAGSDPTTVATAPVPTTTAPEPTTTASAAVTTEGTATDAPEPTTTARTGTTEPAAVTTAAAPVPPEAAVTVPSPAAGLPSLEIVLREPSVVSSATSSLFLQVLPLRSGSVIAFGQDNDDEDDDESGLDVWRSTDGGASFSKLARDAIPLLGNPLLFDVAESDGSAFAFGEDPSSDGQVFAVRSDDDGVTWTNEFLGTGLLAWAGVVGGHATVARLDTTAAGFGLEVSQYRDGSWVISGTPATTPVDAVRTIAELDDGTAVAVGQSCEVAPAECLDAETFVWLSDDGGSTWHDAGRIDGVPTRSATFVSVGGTDAAVAISGQDAGGAVRTVIVGVDADGRTTPLAEHRWPGASVADVSGVARVGANVFAAGRVATDEPGSVPHLLVASTETGSTTAVDLGATFGLFAGFGLTTIDGTITVYGATNTGPTPQPALVDITPV